MMEAVVISQVKRTGRVSGWKNRMKRRMEDKKGEGILDGKCELIIRRDEERTVRQLW